MLACSFLIELSSKLLVTRTGIKARSSSILGRIRPLILELLALEWRKFHTFELGISLKPVGQSWSNFMCSIIRVGEGCIRFWGRLTWHIGLRWAIVALWATCQTSSPLTPLGRLKPNFMWSILGTGEQKFIQMVQVTCPRWPPCPYMVKTLKNLLLRNQVADDLETWYAALGAWVLPSLFKWLPWVDLYLFYGKVKFGRICFCMGKG